jgi:hypothetical protein
MTAFQRPKRVADSVSRNRGSVRTLETFLTFLHFGASLFAVG